MCDLCKSIVNEKDIEKVDYWERNGAIIYDPESDTYGIYIQHDDDYYSGRAFDIKYCPECGRKLMTAKEKIEKLEKENKELKEKLVKKEKSSDSHSSGWDFHWDGRGDYLEARRCFYGDFS